MSMYEQIARYYDLTHETLTEDIDYVVSLAGAVGGAVLELGCGTGRLLLHLARAAIQVTGLDNSPAMLARARRRMAGEPESVRGRVQLVEADMTAFTLPGLEATFALAVVSDNTFMHLSAAEAPDALRHIGRHLAPGGKLFLDVINPLTLAASSSDGLLSEGLLNLEGSSVDREAGTVVLHFSSSWLDEEGQLLQITRIYDETPEAGGPVHRTVTKFVTHYYYPHQLELLLLETGFRLEQLSGDYDDSEYTEGSKRLLVLASRQ